MQTIQKLTQFDYYHCLGNLSGDALVFFTSPACGACKQLRKALERYVQQYDNLRVFEIDAVHESGLVKTFEVFHLPSMFLYRDGQFHCELHSEAHPQKLHAAIAKAYQMPAEEEP